MRTRNKSSHGISKLRVFNAKWTALREVALGQRARERGPGTIIVTACRERQLIAVEESSRDEEQIERRSGQCVM
jgi:hypothetical protein